MAPCSADHNARVDSLVSQGFRITRRTEPPARVVVVVHGMCIDNAKPTASAGIGMDWGHATMPSAERLPGPQTKGRSVLWVRFLVD